MNKTITFSLLFSVITVSSIQAQSIEEVETAMKFEQYDVAKHDLYQLIKVEPNQGKHFFNLGSIHLKENQSDSAMIYFKQGLKATKNFNINNIGIGQLSLNEGKDKEARSKFNAAQIRLPKNDIETYLLVSKAYIESTKPDPEKAMEAAKKAIKVNPKRVEGYIALGDAYMADRSSKLATSAYREALEIDKTNPLAKIKIANVFRFNNNYEDALKTLNEVVNEHPDYELVYKELAQTYAAYARFSFDKTKNIQAVSNYAKFHSMIGESVDSDNAYADFLVKVRDFKGLETLMKDKWLSRGDNFKVYKYAAISAYNNGKYDDAYTFITKYFDVQDKPQQIVGVDYLYLGLAEIEKAKKQDGTLDDAKYQLAVANIKKGLDLDKDLASELYEHGLKLFKDEKYAQSYHLFNLGTTNKENENYVYDLYYKANALYLTHNKPLFNNQLQTALSTLDELIKVSPSTHEAYLLQARINLLINTDASKMQAEKAYENFINLLKTKKLINDKELQEAVKESYTYIGVFNKDKNVEKAKVNLDKAAQL
ncbi:tetratricopeptide repeat protein [Myroides ceti]|uniref:Tetratricopeptide repeat protein n=1 Tax=Paenimyroides ceti TaxID=395087 RepID=A0ABT8CRQ5_9FLAO|nr:tetratricopeptide repeat protein [Paenimyroides ceti]MDN3706328.1 tetratricopeptide repeat protein [Paenimyroides ceti]